MSSESRSPSRRVLARVGRVVRRSADTFPLTPLGLFVAAGGASALKWLAYGQLDLVMLVLGYGAVGLVATSVLFVSASALWWIFRRRGKKAQWLAPTRLDTFVATPSGFAIPSLGWMPLVVSRWTIEAPSSLRAVARAVRGKTEEDLLAIDRGLVRRVVRRFVIEDVFGLARVAVTSESPVSLDVFPGLGSLRSMPLLSSFAGGDDLPHPRGLDAGDRVELRRYVPGDPARFVHWKVFARTRKLMVRTPERALTEARRTVAYLVAGPEDDASAAAARAAVEQGALGGEWVFGSDADPARTAGSREEALESIARSIEARRNGAEGLGGFLSRAERSGPASIVVFVPPVPGPWLERVLSSLRARRAARVVIGIDAVQERARRPFWRDILSSREEDSGTRAEDLEEVIRAFEGAGVEVLVVERGTGKVLSRAHRRGMDAAERRVA